MGHQSASGVPVQLGSRMNRGSPLELSPSPTHTFDLVADSFVNPLPQVRVLSLSSDKSLQLNATICIIYAFRLHGYVVSLTLSLSLAYVCGTHSFVCPVINTIAIDIENFSWKRTDVFSTGRIPFFIRSLTRRKYTVTVYV